MPASTWLLAIGIGDVGSQQLKVGMLHCGMLRPVAASKVRRHIPMSLCAYGIEARSGASLIIHNLNSNWQ